MGRSFFGTGRGPGLASSFLNAVIQGNVVQSSFLNAFIATTNEQSASLNGVIDDSSHLLISSTLNAVIASPTLLTGLLGYWKLDGGATASAGPNGTETDMSYLAGKIGLAGSFNGTTSVINCGNTISLDSSNWSMSIWVNPTTTVGFRRLLSYYGNGPTLYNANSIVSIVHSGTVDFGCGITLSNGVWSHIVVTRAGSTIRAYSNGSQSAQNTSFTATYTADSSVRIGNSTAFNEPYSGLLDEVGLWNRALTPTEVSDLYNAGNGLTHPF